MTPIGIVKILFIFEVENAVFLDAVFIKERLSFAGLRCLENERVLLHRTSRMKIAMINILIYLDIVRFSPIYYFRNTLKNEDKYCL